MKVFLWEGVPIKPRIKKAGNGWRCFFIHRAHWTGMTVPETIMAYGSSPRRAYENWISVCERRLVHLYGPAR